MTRIGVPKESFPDERRVALDPAAVRKLKDHVGEILVESHAGTAAGFPDNEYREAGATVSESRESVFSADIVTHVRGLSNLATLPATECMPFRPRQISIALWDPLGTPPGIHALARLGASCLALELVPRTTRAQAMDVLSSMATLAGYRAVILAANELPKLFPMLMTAAGTVLPARVLVLGAGVAGLQAMATAKRLGALVEGYDVREAAREQITSVGARFLDLGLTAHQVEVAGGYARALGEAFEAEQQRLLAGPIARADVVITTAAVPGKRSPILISAEAVAGMRPGSVVVDLAADRGGNCEVTSPGERKTVGGITILGPTNPASDLAYHASQMFARNMTAVVQLLLRDGTIHWDMDDEVLREITVVRDGKIVHPLVPPAA